MGENGGLTKKIPDRGVAALGVGDGGGEGLTKVIPGGGIVALCTEKMGV